MIFLADTLSVSFLAYLSSIISVIVFRTFICWYFYVFELNHTVAVIENDPIKNRSDATEYCTIEIILNTSRYITHEEEEDDDGGDDDDNDIYQIRKLLV